MIELLETYFKSIKTWITIIIVLFIAIATYCAYNAYNDTWIIEDGHFKTIYDNRNDCINSNPGSDGTEMCDDETQVIYRDK